MNRAPTLKRESEIFSTHRTSTKVGMLIGTDSSLKAILRNWLTSNFTFVTRQTPPSLIFLAFPVMADRGGFLVWREVPFQRMISSLKWTLLFSLGGLKMVF